MITENIDRKHMHEILLNIESKETRYAYLYHGQLHDLIVDRKKSRQITGNIYRGRVTNILHNIQSAFIDINEGENGFIHISDILENTKKFEEMFDMDFDLDYDISKMESSRKPKDISQLLKIDQPVLVQVVKEPIGTKGRPPDFQYLHCRPLSRFTAEQSASRRVAQNRR